MTSDAITEEAEFACALLFRTLGAHRTAVQNLSYRRRARRLKTPEEDREQIQCQATLVRMLSITESFCAERLLQLVEGFVEPLRHKSVAKIWDSVSVSATSGWKDQQKAYKDWLGVNVNWGVVEHLAEARNAVAHGLGTLTRRQLRNEQSVRNKLRAVGIELDGGRIVLTDKVLADAASACREHIKNIDRGVSATLS